MTNGFITETDAGRVGSAEALLHIDLFTDAVCPCAFSAEPDLAALRWHYGNQLDWATRLVVLSETAEEINAAGLTADLVQKNSARLAREFGMPIDTALRDHLMVARLPDLAIKAVQLNRADLADRFIRALRVAWMTEARAIDEIGPLREVAAEVGLDADALERWMGDPLTLADYEADKLAARTPHSAALALSHKLGGPAGSRRYTCPSLEISPIGRPDEIFVAPGFQGFNVYDVAIANLAPQVRRRPPAEDPLEVLAWSDWPLAAAEVARIMDTDREHAVSELTRVGAINQHGYWRAP